MIGNRLKHRMPRRGMTLAELMVGLAITGIIGSAVASFTFTTGTAWRNTEAAQTAENLAHLAAVRVSDSVRSARLFGAWNAGDINNGAAAPPAGVLLWFDDLNDDGLIQTSEILLLEFDPAAGKLNARRQPAPKIDVIWTYAQFTSSSAIETFRLKAGRNPVSSGLMAVQFGVKDDLTSNNRPQLSYQVRTRVGGRVESFAGCVAIRAPSARPS